MKKIVRLTESDLTNLVRRIISEKKGKKSKENDEDDVMSILDQCIEDTPKEDFDDVEDWVEEVFSSCESEFGDDMTEEDLENFKDEYYEYVMDCWDQEEDDDDDFSDDDEDDYSDDDDFSDDDDDDFSDDDDDDDDYSDDDDDDYSDDDDDYSDDDDDDYSDDDDDYSDDDDFGTMRGRFFDKDDEEDDDF